MADEVTKTEEKALKPETTQNSLTAAIGLIATAAIDKDELSTRRKLAYGKMECHAELTEAPIMRNYL